MTTLATILKYASEDFLLENGLSRKSQSIKGNKKVTETSPTELELQFLYYWRLSGGEDNDWKHTFHPFPERPRMHVDFMHSTQQIAVEVDGGQFMKRSGHNNVKGVQRDAEKLALCNKHGIMLFRLPTAMVNYEEVMKIRDTVKEKL